MSNTSTVASPGTGAPPKSITTARALVAAQAALLAGLAVLPKRRDWPVPTVVRLSGGLAVVAGAGIAAVGASALGRGLTALPLPNEHAELRTGGLYGRVRHPVYTGVLLAAGAKTVTSGSRWTLAAFAALVLLLNGKARFEERHLIARFPGYPDYADRTPRFIPGRRDRPSPIDGKEHR